MLHTMCDKVAAYFKSPTETVRKSIKL